MKDFRPIPNYYDYDMLSIISEITQRLKCVYVQRAETDIPSFVVADVIQGLDDANFERLINLLKDNYQGFDWWIRSKDDMYFDPLNKIDVFKEFEDACKEFLYEHEWCKSLTEGDLYNCNFGRLVKVYSIVQEWYGSYIVKTKYNKNTIVNCQDLELSSVVNTTDERFIQRTKGRPIKHIRESILKEEDRVLKTLHKYIDNKSGRVVCLPLLVMIDLGYMTKPTHNQVVDEFGKVISKSNYNNYMCKTKHSSDEFLGVMKSIEDELSLSN